MELKSAYTYVELFSGCGGMSLGLESAGFDRLLANEISPMAAETFAYNLIEGARSGTSPDPRNPGSWDPYFSFLTSPETPAPDGIMTEKVFRDWRAYQPLNGPLSDKVKKALKHGTPSNLLVGDVKMLTRVLEDPQGWAGVSSWPRLGSIDVLAGGPPCQSFSLAGRRQKDHPRNSLFHSFVRIAEILKPRAIIFENVIGITRPFSDGTGVEWHPWHEVCRAFRQVGYIPVPSLVNAADFGVPQSRPRFILIGIREDVARELQCLHTKGSPLFDAIELGRKQYGLHERWREGDDRALIFRIDHDETPSRWPAPLFPAPCKAQHRVSVGEAIGDLHSIEKGEEFWKGAYSRSLDRLLKRPSWIPASASIPNHGIRQHGGRTLARFRILRLLASGGFRAKNMTEVGKRREEALRLLTGKKLFLPVPGGGFSKITKSASRADVKKLLDELVSAKHAQRCLNPLDQAPAQLSIPDDFIHWNADRVLTIREMARIQSFPDWFEFRSKETTGGLSRAYEVPQYTQVGNAVPPLLALKFGSTILRLLQRLDHTPTIR